MPYIRAKPPCRGRERKDLWLLNSGTNPSPTAATVSPRASRRSCARRVDLSPRRRATGEEREFQAGSGCGAAEGVASGCAGIFMNLFHRARKPEFRGWGKKNARAPRAGTARVREASQVPSLRLIYGVGEFFSSFPVFGLPLILLGVTIASYTFPLRVSSSRAPGRSENVFENARSHSLSLELIVWRTRWSL